MLRRDFLKTLAAISAGVALRPVPVLGQSHSELIAPRTFAGVAAPVGEQIGLLYWQKPTTLAHAVGPWDTTIHLNSPFPVNVGALLKVDDELMRIVAKRGRTLTVQRGVINIAAMPHR